MANKLKEKAENEIKKQKKKIKNKIILKILPFIAPALIVFIIAIYVYAIFSGVNQLIAGIGQSISNFFSSDETSIEITNEMLDQLITTIESAGIDMDELGLLRRN